MSFQDVAFIPSRASFSTTFLKHCDIGECLGTSTCLKTMVGVSKGMLPERYYRSTKFLFVSIKFNGDHVTG